MEEGYGECGWGVYSRLRLGLLFSSSFIFFSLLFSDTITLPTYISGNMWKRDYAFLVLTHPSPGHFLIVRDQTLVVGDRRKKKFWTVVVLNQVHSS